MHAVCYKSVASVNARLSASIRRSLNPNPFNRHPPKVKVLSRRRKNHRGINHPNKSLDRLFLQFYLISSTKTNPSMKHKYSRN